MRNAIGITFTLGAPLLAGGCAKPDLAASFVCQPASLSAVTVPSSAYASSSIADLQTKAAGGDRAAARVLGERYEQGVGVELDLKQAVEWYETAAFIPPRILPVYMPGSGKTPPTFLQVSTGAPASGDLAAMAHLGELYVQGHGVRKDQARGERLLSCVVTSQMSINVAEAK